jgi:hypothetical protein
VVSFLDAGSETLADYEYLANKYQTPLVNHFSSNTSSAAISTPVASIAAHH